MGSRRAMLITLTVSMLLNGCAEPSTDTAMTTTGPSITTTSAATTTTTMGDPQTTIGPEATTTSAPSIPPCLEGGGFATNGVVATVGSGSGDAALVGGIRYAHHEGCERIVIDLQTDAGAPASTLGAAEVSIDAGLGVVTVSLPAEVDDTAVADSLLEGELIRTAYVYRRLDGSLAIDLHVTSPIAARGLLVLDPARLVVDVRGDDGAPATVGAPRYSATVVLLSPLSGPAEYPILVSGYARTFEANVVATLTDGTITKQLSTTAADWSTTWGAFELEIERPDDGPFGPAELSVGDDEPSGGGFAGVTVTLDLR